MDRLAWSAHDKKWCQANPGNCPPLPTLIPVNDYVSKPFSKPLRMPMKCDKPAEGMPKFTVLMLSRGKETETLGNTLRSYDQAGFFEVSLTYHSDVIEWIVTFTSVSYLLQSVNEIIVFFNERHPDAEALLQKYLVPPYNLKVT